MRKFLTKWLPFLVLIALTMLSAGIVIAQDRTVTDDEVNAIAKKLYCPVCENIPLDACGTAACQDWRYEIRIQLEEGKSEQEIIDDFVLRFGDRVVGTPQDPVLRALSLVTPWIVIFVAVIGVIFAMIRWRRQEQQPAITEKEVSEQALNDYHAMLENDLQGE